VCVFVGGCVRACVRVSVSVRARMCIHSHVDVLLPFSDDGGLACCCCPCLPNPKSQS
jgi:hypothetical protein